MKGEVYEEISFQTVTGDPDLDPCDRCSEYPGTAASGETFGRENRKCLEENVGRIREGMKKSGTAENTSKGKTTVSEEKERIALY